VRALPIDGPVAVMVAREALVVVLLVGMAFVVVEGLAHWGRALARVPADLVRDAVRRLARRG
jgi:hypothetical protein